MKLFTIILLIALAITAIGAGFMFDVFTPEPEHVHTYGEWEVKTPATCTEAGVEHRVCECNEEETREIAATGHTYGEWVTKTPATCTEAEVEHRECTCGAEETREGDPATGHTAVSISAVCTKTDAMKYDVLTAEDFAVTATCGCGASYAVTEGITLENATLEVQGENTVTVKLGDLSATVTVNAAKFNKVVNGTIVDDTYVRSGGSYKENNYADAEELYAYGDGTSRVLFRIDFSDIINSNYYESFKAEAKVQITFTLTTGTVDDSTKYTFKVYPVTEGRSNANFSDLKWSNYNNDTYLFGWGNANDIVKKTDSHNSSVDGNVITLTFTYREIEECVDAESGDAIFVFAIWASGTKIGSMENTTEANRPTVRVIFSEDHAHAYIEQVVEEKYLASANCEEKAKYYYSCSCGEASTETFEYGEVIEHTFGEWETKTPATCTEAEVEYRVCTCGAEETREGDAALEHNMVTNYDETNHWTECDREGCDETTEAEAHFGGTATETEQAVCEGCGQPYGGTLSHVHSYGEWESFTPAGCEQDEVLIRYCDCGVSETGTGVAAFGHDMQTKFDENNHWTECAHNCGTSTEAVAHSGGTATETEQAVCEGCGQPYGELKEAEKQEYTIAGTIVDDGAVSSSGKTATYGTEASPELVTYCSSSTNNRAFFRFNFSNIINSGDFEGVKDSAKVQFTFTLTENTFTEDTKVTFKAFDKDYSTRNADLSTITWNNYNTDEYALGWGNASIELISKTTLGDNGTCENGVLTITLNYSDIKGAIDENGNALFVMGIWVKGTKIASMENTEYAAPAVNFIYEK